MPRIDFLRKIDRAESMTQQKTEEWNSRWSVNIWHFAFAHVPALVLDRILFPIRYLYKYVCRSLPQSCCCRLIGHSSNWMRIQLFVCPMTTFFFNFVHWIMMLDGKWDHEQQRIESVSLITLWPQFNQRKSPDMRKQKESEAVFCSRLPSLFLQSKVEMLTQSLNETSNKDELNFSVVSRQPYFESYSKIQTF